MEKKASQFMQIEKVMQAMRKPGPEIFQKKIRHFFSFAVQPLVAWTFLKDFDQGGAIPGFILIHSCWNFQSSSQSVNGTRNDNGLF